MGIDGEMEFLKTAIVRITPEILSLVAEIDEFKGARRAVGQIAPERLSSLRHGVDATQRHTTWQFR
ncbi:hypothetical protein G6M23_10535 [Agrobacterium tumefaciens]|jgi:hypothetical protein|nr:hypothetical protein [Agrobacterium tumefaciens]NSY46267.1 hypothetical protein [Agrobacterium tumefaciens]NSZ09535.1 hypothetical protein [Agrobacterium tumefaciens]NTD85945.1 hypothetical protein [Agrobacterium tumefaciens]NTD91769.1 hypothetical protein [Agrobacterium tumefaciens]